MRTCKKCSEEKPLSKFGTYRREGEMFFLHKCHVCLLTEQRERQAKYKAKHGDKIRKRARDARRERYWNDPEFRELCKEQSRDSYYRRKEAT